MKSVPKLIQRFVSIMLLSSVLLVILNITMLAVYTAKQMPNIHPCNRRRNCRSASLGWPNIPFAKRSCTYIENF